MKKPITKSLFVDYCEFPKIAWWRFNDLAKYKKIKKLDNEELSDQIIDLGKTVESIVGDYLELKYGTKKVDLFSDNPEVINDDSREDDDDTWTLELSFEERLKINIEATKTAILNKEKILFQPGFLLDDCYVRADFMILNISGNYDLIEVKAKSGIRNKVKDDLEDKKIGKVEDKFINDVSFQKNIINKLLKEWGQNELNKVYIAHLNNDYIRKGSIDITRLVKIDENIGEYTKISVIQRGKSTQIERDDQLIVDSIIEERIKRIRTELALSEEKFNELHPFPGNKYLEYFGEDKSFGTVCGIPRLHHTKAPVVRQFYDKGKLDLMLLDEEELCLFDSSGGGGSTRKFLDNYIYCKNNKCVVIEKEIIKEALATLKFPICFYDYESVSVPVPLLDNTYSYQQVIVQYSLHKLYEDGTIKHFGGVLQGEGEFRIENIILPSDGKSYISQSNKVVTGTQKEFLEEFLKDIGEDIDSSSFIVWYKGFENSRNNEIAEIYPELANSFLKINEATFDLYEIFSKMHYFDLNFKGSASIKKVLPVLVPEMSYDGMNIGKGDVAMQALKNLISGSITDQNERTQKIQDLLVYCRQDSLAMLEIYEKLILINK